MINVFCVLWGDKYSHRYVHNLKRAVARHLSVQHQFTCITNQIIEGIWTIPEQCQYPGWWQKIGLFRKPWGPSIYIDLDMVIVDSIDWLIEYTFKEFAVIENWGSRKREGPLYEGEISSAVMCWNGTGETHRIFDEFSQREIDRLHPHGDQTWITEVMRGRITLMPQERICSYKRHCLGKSGPPPEASIVAFHGKPAPHEVTDSWVFDHWDGDTMRSCSGPA